MTKQLRNRDLNSYVGASYIHHLSHYISLQRNYMALVKGLLNFLDFEVPRLYEKCLIVTMNTYRAVHATYICGMKLSIK